MRNLLPLTELPLGHRGTVTGITGDLASCRRLLELGMVQGTPIQVIRRAPLGDPIELDVAGSRYAMRREVAARISVEADRGAPLPPASSRGLRV